MFDHHRKSPWFAEKYDPSEEMRVIRTRVRKEGWRGRLHAFLLDLEAGKFDPDLNETESAGEVKALSKEGAANGRAGDASGTIASDAKADTNGRDTGNGESKASGGDEMQVPIDADEEGGDHETNGKSAADTRRGMGTALGTRGEEISVPTEGNQVMIRTIPPDIGRVKLEEVSGHYLWVTVF
jgi:hypothetical protein